jgi:hypothetical protein
MTNTSPAIRLDIKPRIVEIRLSKENPTKKKALLKPMLPRLITS